MCVPSPRPQAESPSLQRPLAPSPPRTALSPPDQHPPPRRIPTPCNSAVLGCLQSAAELRHVQGHNDVVHVSGAYPRPDNQPRALLSCRLRRRPRPPPSHLPARTSPRVVCPPCDSADRGCLQPAAELRHVQGHNDAVHVLCAYARSDLQPRALPCNAARAVAPARRPLTSRGPHLPPRRMPTLRQGAGAFNQPLTLDTSKVTDMETMFAVRALAPTSSREPFPAMPLAPSPPPTALSPPSPNRPPRRMPTLRLGRTRMPSTSR